MRYKQYIRNLKSWSISKARYVLRKFVSINFLDIQWYYNNVQLRESDKYHIEIEESTASLEIRKISYEDIGFYVCKLVNEIGMTMTRAKFDISSTTGKDDVEEKVAMTSGKKKVTKKLTTRQTLENESKKMHKTHISIVPATKQETTLNIVKVRQPVSVLVEQSGISEVMTVKDRKEVEISDKIQIVQEKQVKKSYEERTRITREQVSTIRSKISQKTITIEDVQEIKQHEEVNILLEQIDAVHFGNSGEAALRDIATIGLLLRYDCTITEITYMYEQNIFISLKKPESQAALVQLVEREEHEELITEILSESYTEDESVLAATVGFKAFIRMIQRYDITIETVIRKFVREDFVSQDWKISGKEV